MTDPDTTAAIDALTWRLRNREPGTDDEVFALEFITALRSRGWRVTNTAPPPAHEAGPGLPAREDAVAAVAELRARFAAGAPEASDDRPGAA